MTWSARYSELMLCDFNFGITYNRLCTEEMRQTSMI